MCFEFDRCRPTVSRSEELARSGKARCCVRHQTGRNHDDEPCTLQPDVLRAAEPDVGIHVREAKDKRRPRSGDEAGEAAQEDTVQTVVTCSSPVNFIPALRDRFYMFYEAFDRDSI